MGSYAEVYSVIDLSNGNQCALKLVIIYMFKFFQTTLKENFKKETWILKNLSSYNSSDARKIIWSIILQFRYIQKIHNSGYGHQDLKLDNILLKSNNFEDSESSLLCIVDFGISKALNILDKSDKPKIQDDLISILYILIYLEKGSLPWIQNYQNCDKTQMFHKVKNIKKQFHRLQYDLSTKSNQAKIGNNSGLFEQLISKIDNWNNKQESIYGYLINQLVIQLEDREEILDWNMDWTKTSKKWTESYHHNQGIFERILHQARYQLPLSVKSTISIDSAPFKNQDDTDSNNYSHKQKIIGNQGGELIDHAFDQSCKTANSSNQSNSNVNKISLLDNDNFNINFQNLMKINLRERPQIFKLTNNKNGGKNFLGQDATKKEQEQFQIQEGEIRESEMDEDVQESFSYYEDLYNINYHINDLKLQCMAEKNKIN
ncbi:protein kinase domain protein [Stylonychia lemnae]|uniref:Casein kinase I n=1 Tax=Stylonychia lemnae TaxID=5949 RepID=A0A078B4Q2_STYLE|nr:protein kinase domain protein [Stylonychia lemnae]|eukprot:CDW89246.1 protein kinase domain protein [Stylonychia lemnae]